MVDPSWGPAANRSSGLLFDHPNTLEATCLIQLSRVSLSFQLSERASNIPHSPMLRDLAVTNAENIARCEAQGFSRRGHAEVLTSMSSTVDEACCRHLAAGERDLGCDRKVGHPFEPRGEKSDSSLFGTYAGSLFWCRSAHLVIYVILGEQRSKGVKVMRT